MPPTTFEDDVIDHEDETPFLKNDDPDALPHKPTPLPMKQISVLLVLWIAESVIDNSISPYLNEVRTVEGLRNILPRAESAFSSSEISRSWAETCERWATTQGS